MSKISEYLETAIGLDTDGRPASTSQFSFGQSPFKIAETEDFEDVIEIEVVCHSDAIVDVKILDEMISVSFDFSNDMETFKELADELDSYKMRLDHVTNSLNEYMNELALAERNENEAAMEDIYMHMRSLSIPFMLPTIIPICFGGSVQIGFTEDPKFVFYTSDNINSLPHKVTMVFSIQSIFCKDNIDIYSAEDSEAEIAAQQEEMWYYDQLKKIEEENYHSQFGAGIYVDDDDDDEHGDSRLKGVRVK